MAGDGQPVVAKRGDTAIVHLVDRMLGVSNIVVVKGSLVVHDIVHAAHHCAGSDIIGILDHQLARTYVQDAPFLRAHQLHGQVLDLIGVVGFLFAAHHQGHQAAQRCYVSHCLHRRFALKLRAKILILIKI